MMKKVVLVTGASSGIGRSCAEAFAAVGASLAITGRNNQALDETKAKCCSYGLSSDKVLTVVADLAKDEDCQSVVDATIKKFDRLDVLVNNAGILVSGSTEEISMEEYDRAMRVNTRAPFLLCKLSLPHLLKTKGNIINVSSVTGLRAFPGVVAYNMSKAALDHMTRTLSLEVAARGVRVNAVNPAVIVTDLHKRSGMNDETYKKFIEHGKTTHAMGRVGELHEVSSVVVFLASEKASFITGQTLAIDGGKSIICPR